MSEKMRRLALTMAGLAILFGPIAVCDPAVAQPAGATQTGDDRNGDAPPQIKLTQKQIDDLLAAQPDLAAAQPADPAKAAQPDPKMQARIEAAVKRHGFRDLEAYESVFGSIGIVLAGIDPETKTYVGPAAVIKKQMAQIQADKSLSTKDKDQALSDLKEALGATGSDKPVAGNADLVIKNYDKITGALKGSD